MAGGARQRGRCAAARGRSESQLVREEVVDGHLLHIMRPEPQKDGSPRGILVRDVLCPYVKVKNKGLWTAAVDMI